MKKKILSLMLVMVLLLTMGIAFAAPVAAIEYDTSLVLENKDSNWDPIADSTQGTLLFNSSSPTFEYSFSATGLLLEEDYSLIYYADTSITDSRFVEWGGAYPGAFIAEFTSDAEGAIAGSGTQEINMDLPCAPDANVDGGAKIWLVPSDALPTAYPAQNDWAFWDATGILFETELITYNDTDVEGSIVGTTTTIEDDIIQISVSPTSFDFGSLRQGECSVSQAVTITNLSNMTVKVTASTESSFYNAALKIDSQLIGVWFDSIAETLSRSMPLEVCVPDPWDAGVETGTIIFWAEEY